MGGGEQFDAAGALGGQLQPNDTLIGIVVDPLDQSAVDGPVHQLDDAVVAEQEVVSSVADGWRPAVPSDGEQQLVLRGRETGRLGPVLAPSLEAAQTVAEVEEAAVVVVGQ